MNILGGQTRFEGEQEGGSGAGDHHRDASHGDRGHRRLHRHASRTAHFQDRLRRALVRGLQTQILQELVSPSQTSYVLITPIVGS